LIKGASHLRRVCAPPFSINNIPENHPQINEAAVMDHMTKILQNHYRLITGSFDIRGQLLDNLRYCLNDEDRNKYEEITKRISKTQEEYLNSLIEMKQREVKNQLRVVFDLTNKYRNSVKKDFTAQEDIIRKCIKPVLSEKKELKKMINVDYPKSLKLLHNEEELLRKRIAELLYEPKSKPKG
jgi:hypothetical protein